MESQTTKEKNKTVNKTEVKQKHVLPTHRDLALAKQKGIPLLKYSKHAVFVKKMSQKSRVEFSTREQVTAVKETIESMCAEFDYDFILNVQYGENTVLTDEELAAVEEMQQVVQLKNIVMLEKSKTGTCAQFAQQLTQFKQRNQGKHIVVTTEPDTAESVAKIVAAKNLGITKWVVNFRSYKGTYLGLRALLRNLDEQGMETFVLGVFPRKSRTRQGSMLGIPLAYGAHNVGHQIAWGGGPSTLMLLCDDWIYREQEHATTGAHDYDGLDRSKILVGKSESFSTTFAALDALNQASKLLLTGKVPTERDLERLAELRVQPRVE